MNSVTRRSLTVAMAIAPTLPASTSVSLPPEDSTARLATVTELRLSSPLRVDRIFVDGYKLPGDGGGGNYVPTNVTDRGAGVVQDKLGNRWKLHEPIVVPRQFGASADGNADDTSAIQAAIDYLVREEICHTVRFGGFIYKISSEIIFRCNHLVRTTVDGEQSTIIQGNGEAPIFSIQSTGVSHSNIIRNFSARWQDSPSGHLHGRCFLFFPSTGNSDYFNNEIDNITIDNGHWVIRSEGPSFWGNVCRRIFVSGNCTGGVGYFHPDHPTGQPNNYFSSHYVDCHSIAGAVYDTSAFVAVMDAIELNNGTIGPQLIHDESGGEYHIRNARIEVAEYTKARAFIHIPNGKLTVDCLELNNIKLSAPLSIFSVNGNPDGFVLCRSLVLSLLVDQGGGELFLSETHGGGTIDILQLDSARSLPAALAKPDGNGKVAVTRVHSRCGTPPIQKLPSGSVALTPTASTTLHIDEANGRTSTISLFRPAPSTAYEGMKFEFLKTARLGHVEIFDADGGAIAVIPSNSCGRVTVMAVFSGNAPNASWLLIGYEKW